MSSTAQPKRPADLMRGVKAPTVNNVIIFLDHWVIAELFPANDPSWGLGGVQRQVTSGINSGAGTARTRAGQQQRGYSTVMSPVIPAQSWSAHHIS
jgi:hypothetical protein